MTHDENSGARPNLTTRKVLLRIFSFLVAATIIGYLTHLLTTYSNQQPGPAGFLRGMLHGAIMPGALPNLLIGSDVTIYAPNNTGVSYKLGYTMGVDVCGVFFFGYFFWRLSRWTKRLKANGRAQKD